MIDWWERQRDSIERLAQSGVDRDLLSDAVEGRNDAVIEASIELASYVKRLRYFASKKGKGSRSQNVAPESAVRTIASCMLRAGKGHADAPPQELLDLVDVLFDLNRPFGKAPKSREQKLKAALLKAKYGDDVSQKWLAKATGAKQDSVKAWLSDTAFQEMVEAHRSPLGLANLDQNINDIWDNNPPSPPKRGSTR